MGAAQKKQPKSDEQKKENPETFGAWRQ